MKEIRFDPKRSMLHDKFSRMVAPSQDEDYLFVGKSPKVGQRAEIRIAFRNSVSSTSSVIPRPPLYARQDSFTSLVSASSHGTNNSSLSKKKDRGLLCRLSGVVTRVGDLLVPDVFDGMMSGTIIQRYNEKLKKGRKRGAGSGDLPILTRENICSMKSTAMDQLSRLAEQDGTLHGQQLVVYAVLCPEYWEMANDNNGICNGQQQLPIRKDRVYRIVLQAEEHLRCHWSVIHILEVMDKFKAMNGEVQPSPEALKQPPSSTITDISSPRSSMFCPRIVMIPRNSSFGSPLSSFSSPRSSFSSPRSSFSSHRSNKVPPRNSIAPLEREKASPSPMKRKVKKVPAIFREWLRRNPCYLENDEDDDDSLEFNSDDEDSFCLLVVKLEQEQGTRNRNPLSL